MRDSLPGVGQPFARSPLTRRGWGVLGLVLACLVMGWLNGARTLNAVVVPLLLALLAGYVQVRRAPVPSVDRTAPSGGFIGESGTETLEWSTDRPVAATVRDATGDGLRAPEATGKTTLVDGTTLEYEVTYARRGIHTVGPVRVELHDVLGLFQRVERIGGSASVPVYPRVLEIGGVGRHELRAIASAAVDERREEFDRLREYAPGDSLRDIHWKATAKRGGEPLVVKEFVADEDRGELVVAVETSGGADGDRVEGEEGGSRDVETAGAEAAASVVTFLLSFDVDVALETPDRTIQGDAGVEHRHRVLRTLAAFEAGEIDAAVRDRADVWIRADAEDVTVTVGDASFSFDQLRVDGGGEGSVNGPSEVGGHRRTGGTGTRGGVTTHREVIG